MMTVACFYNACAPDSSQDFEGVPACVPSLLPIPGPTHLDRLQALPMRGHIAVCRGSLGPVRGHGDRVCPNCSVLRCGQQGTWASREEET